MELSAGADADSNSSPSTPLDSARSCHLLLLLPPLLTHRDSLPPAPGTLVTRLSRSSHAPRLLPPLPPCRRLIPLLRQLRELLPHADAYAVVDSVLSSLAGRCASAASCPRACRVPPGAAWSGSLIRAGLVR